MLVPILAPIMIPIPCTTFIIPEFTNPTTITDVAEDDCIIAVTPAPNKIPLSGVLVSPYKSVSSLFPATFLRPSPITLIPYRKSAIPLNSPRNNNVTDTASITTSSFLLFFYSPIHNIRDYCNTVFFVFQEIYSAIAHYSQIFYNSAFRLS